VRSSVEVLRQGDRATEAAHGPRVGACGPAPGHGAAPRHSSSVPQPPVQPNRLEAGSVVRSSVKVLRQGDRAPEAEAAHRHRVGAGGHAPGHGGAEPATRVDATAPEPPCKPTTSRLEVWCGPVSRCSARATGRPRPRRHTSTVSAQVATRHATGGGCSTRPLELRATAPVQANHLEAGGVVLSSVEVLRDWAQCDRAPKAEAAHGHRVGAGGHAPRHGGGCSTRPLELRATTPVQANHLETGGAVLSSVEVLRQGDQAPRRHAGPVSARVAARHATGVQHPPLELSATAPVQANHLEAGGVVLSSVEVLRQGDRAPRRHTGTLSARVAARHATGGAAPATRAERHNPCASQPPRD